MNLTLFGAIALMAFVSDSNGQFGAGFGGGGGGGAPFGFGGPGGFAGMFAPPEAAAARMAGQEASKNAIDLAVNSAMTKVNVTELSPELQVNSIRTRNTCQSLILNSCVLSDSKTLGRTTTSPIGC